MLKLLTTGVFIVLTSGCAFAACPSGLPGTLPEEIRANTQRLVCLQDDLAEANRQRQQQLELDQLQRSFESQQLRQRLDAVPSVPSYSPPVAVQNYFPL